MRRGKRSVVTDVVAIEGPGHGGPRITFTVFRSMDDPMLRSWVRFRSPLVGQRKLGRLAVLKRRAAMDFAEGVDDALDVLG